MVDGRVEAGQERFIDVLRVHPKMHACSRHKVVGQFSAPRLAVFVLPAEFIYLLGIVRDSLLDGCT